MEDDGEIEYLDEDEDIVQQCVQIAPTLQTSVAQSDQLTAAEDAEDIEEKIEALLVERKPAQVKRKIKTDDDSDYDPSEDLLLLQGKKRKLNSRKAVRRVEPYIKLKQEKESLNQQSVQNLNKTYENKLRHLPNLTVYKKNSAPPKPEVVKTYSKPVKKTDPISERRKLDIKIPDYEDPLCLPVRAIKNDEYDGKKLKQWNILCLDQLKKADTMFKSLKGDIVSSSRTVVLRTLKNKYTDRIDTTIYGKIIAENNDGEKKTDTFQGTLPKYREKKMLYSYPLQLGSKRHFKHTFEAILTKDNQKEDDILVVYKPKEALSAVYKFIEKNDSSDRNGEECSPQERRALKELTCCKVCAPCYQSSWRGAKKNTNEQSLLCCICGRTFVSVYNLLAHLNTNHTAADVRAHRRTLCETLASVVDYHYRCRICQEQFTSIKLLRKHISKHQGVELFKCEIGNHMAS